MGINLNGKAQTQNAWTAPTQGPLTSPNLKPHQFQDAFLEGEGTVLIRDGLFLIGVLDKKHIGSSQKGIVDSNTG